METNILSFKTATLLLENIKWFEKKAVVIQTKNVLILAYNKFNIIILLTFKNSNKILILMCSYIADLMRSLSFNVDKTQTW